MMVNVGQDSSMSVFSVSSKNVLKKKFVLYCIFILKYRSLVRGTTVNAKTWWYKILVMEEDLRRYNVWTIYAMLAS